MARMIFSAAVMAGTMPLADGVGQAQRPNPFPRRVSMGSAMRRSMTRPVVISFAETT